MTLIRWRPRRDVLGLRGDMNRLFDDFFNWPARWEDNWNQCWRPLVNVEEADDKFMLTAELPGMTKDDINIDVVDNVLTIGGEKKDERDDKEKNFHIVERCYGEFKRTFTLPDTVDDEKIEAEFKDGILRVTIPKVEQPKPKEIKVKVK